MSNIVEAPHRDENVNQLADLRRRIIDGVLTHGLVAPANLRKTDLPFFGSATPHDFPDMVRGHGLDSLNFLKSCYHERVEEELRLRLDGILYKSVDSIMPVMMERDGEETFWAHPANPKRVNYCQDLDLLERRLASCFLVAADWDNLTMGRNAAEEVKPEAFRYLIFPQDIWAEYQRARKKEVQVPVMVTSGVLERPLLGGAFRSMTVPDFETSILQILNELERLAGVWIHGVRLPIAEDIQH